jgi:hypothetical protein
MDKYDYKTLKNAYRPGKHTISYQFLQYYFDYIDPNETRPANIKRKEVEFGQKIRDMIIKKGIPEYGYKEEKGKLRGDQFEGNEIPLNEK